jgi:hypothetical protein
MVRIAGSLSIAGHLGTFNVAIVDVQTPVQALCESVKPYPARPDYSGLTGAGPATKENGAVQGYPADIFSMLAEMQRSIDWLSQRTASVPAIYTNYLPAKVEVPGPAYHILAGRPETAEQDMPAKSPVKSAGESEGLAKQKGSVSAPAMEKSPSVASLDREIVQSGLAIEQFKGDLMDVTMNLAGVQAAIEEIARLSLAGDVEVMPVPAVPASTGRPVPDVPAVEPAHVVSIDRDRFPAEQRATGKAKPGHAPEASEFTRSVARSVGLTKALLGSTIGAVNLPAAVAREVVPDAVARTTAIEHHQADQYLQPWPVAPAREQMPAPPVVQPVTDKAEVSPVVQTIETYNTIISVVKASEVLSSILPMRSVAKGEITQYLLSMPGHPADDRQMQAVIDIGAMLQADAMPMAAPAGTILPTGAGASGDIPDLWLAVRSLQDSMANLKGSVPGMADFIGRDKAIESLPAAAVASGGSVAPRLSIAVEGIKTPGTRIDLPDFSLVTDQFRPMQAMMARLQVPMYGEGGTVAEPTLALVAETGPEYILTSDDYGNFKGQIASLNANYESLWENVLVLRDGIREMTASINDAFSTVSTGGSEAASNNYYGDLWDRFLTHFHISSEDLKSLSTSWTLGGSSAAIGNLGTEYYFNVMEEWLVPDDIGGEGKASGGNGDAGQGQDDPEDKEEEDFWDLMDKIDQINSIRNKRQGKFE